MPTDISWENTTVKLGDLQPWQRNPRKSSKRQAEKMLESWDKFGQVQTVAIGPGMEVYDGHQRLSALLTVYGKGYEVDARQASRELSEDERERLVITLHVGATGAWDWDELANWNSNSLLAYGMDVDALKQLNTDAAALGLLLESEKPTPAEDPGAQVDRAEELREKWGVELGQLWQLGAHRLICGDCTDAAVVGRVMQGERAQMMFTDPPYGVNYEGGHFHSGDVNIKRKREKLADDDTTEIYPAFLPVALAVVDGPCYMWFAGSKARDVYNAVHDNKCEVHALIIWHKTNATYAAMNAQYKQRHEPCLYFKPKGSTLRWCGETTESTVWSQDRDSINEFHPTQKPVALAAKAIGNHDAQTVADFFLGSGTTLIACEQLSRKCRAVEISPAYVAVALQRWADMTGQTPQLVTQEEN